MHYYINIYESKYLLKEKKNKNTAPMIVISREISLQTISPSVSLCPSNMTDSSLSATYFDSGTQICTFHRDFDARTHYCTVRRRAVCCTYGDCAANHCSSVIAAPQSIFWPGFGFYSA